jgi:hypothetical protein
MLERNPNATQQVKRVHIVMQKQQRSTSRLDIQQWTFGRNETQAIRTSTYKRKQTYNTQARTRATHREQMSVEAMWVQVAVAWLRTRAAKWDQYWRLHGGLNVWNATIQSTECARSSAKTTEARTRHAKHHGSHGVSCNIEKGKRWYRLASWVISTPSLSGENLEKRNNILLVKKQRYAVRSKFHGLRVHAHENDIKRARGRERWADMHQADGVLAHALKQTWARIRLSKIT